jgi:hypothetical protein
MVESLLCLAGLNWRVPDFSTVCRRQLCKVHLGIDAHTLEIRAIEVNAWLKPPGRAGHGAHV